MFAIIDIETCGSSFNFGRGRITEICILVHDGLSVVERFSTLLNPECYIAPQFTQLTGITNEMVADAPKFHEVAKDILRLTEGCIFVAHNVSFDYNFIKEEFHSLGYAYKRDTLCTVRLSRKLIPGKASYSLGNLCASLGIEIKDRHRAQGDAEATAILFDLLLQVKATHPQYKNVGVDELMVRKVDKIKQYVLNKLPESCGVYYFLNQDGQIIYIGKSTNMYKRAQSHFATTTKKSKQMLFDLHSVDFVETGSEIIALLLEADEIKRHQPLYNRMRKTQEFSHCIESWTDENGIVNFKIANSEEANNPLQYFATYSAARERLESWIAQHELCIKYCALTKDMAVCFNHQIKKCRGICAGVEGVSDYNMRAAKLLKQNAYQHPHFILVDKGRSVDEHSLIYIKDGKYKGFGYLDLSSAVSDTQTLIEQIKPQAHYPDLDLLVRGWLLKNNPIKLVRLPENDVFE